ncbi:MAG TPA: Ig-like domain-containing protein [Kiritimatiellia bacterium]|nr:Ig-like domain-containing protein [Kiritimatiellia bacterium]HMO97566.1 Ig-like domain-containing protein [Kiritimatiellia bacterium]
MNIHTLIRIISVTVAAAWSSPLLASSIFIEANWRSASQGGGQAVIGSGNYFDIGTVIYGVVGVNNLDLGRGYEIEFNQNRFSQTLSARVVSTFGSGFWLTYDLQKYIISNTRTLIIPQQTFFRPGNGYTDDAEVVFDPPRNNEFGFALGNTNITEIVLGPGLFYQNAVITRDMTIRGAGIGRTLVSGGRGGSVFRILPGVKVTLADMTIFDGLAQSGGGIYNEGELEVVRCEIRNNRAYHYLNGEGGGIFNRGKAKLWVRDSIIRDNIASRNGGGISSSGINSSTMPSPGGDGLARNVVSGSLTNLAGLTPPTDLNNTNQLNNFANDAAGRSANSLFQLGSPKDFFEGNFSNPLEDAITWFNYNSPICVVSNTVIEGNKAGRANAKATFNFTGGILLPLPRLVCFGGGLYNELGLMSVEDSRIDRNEVESDIVNYGGGVASVLGGLSIRNTTINHNLSKSRTVLAAGGAVYTFASYAKISDAQMISNTVEAFFLSSGGGMKNTSAGYAELRRVRIEYNEAGGGGGMANDYKAKALIEDSTVLGNRISGVISANGGGIRNEDGGEVDIHRTTISGNSARGKVKGGGVYNQCTQVRIGDVVPVILSSRVSLHNSTISHNVLDGRGPENIPMETRGAGLYNGSFDRGLAQMVVYSCTVFSNTAARGLINDGGGLRSTGFSEIKFSLEDNIPGTSRVFIANSLFARNIPEDINNSFPSMLTSYGYNMDSDGSGATAAFLSEQALAESARFRTANALLGPLQFNGGPSPTHALFVGSPAINFGAPTGTFGEALSPPTDQRGLLRNLAGRRDIGAYEVIAPTANGESYSMFEDTTLTVNYGSGVILNDFANTPQAVLVSPPANGGFTLFPDGGFIHTPATNFNGTNSFTYRVVDADGVTGAVATATIVVRPRLDWLSMVPVGGTNSFAERHTNIVLTFDENITTGAVLANVSLRGSISGPRAYTAIVVGATARLVPHVWFTYDEEVTVTVLESMTSTIGSPIFPAGSRSYRTFANRGPATGPAETFGVAEEGLLTVGLAQSLLNNDSDPDRDAISVLPREVTLSDYWTAQILANRDPTNVTAFFSGNWPNGSWAYLAPVAAQNGNLNLQTDGTFTYTPNTNFFGTDYFDYRVTDGVFTTTPVRVFITVTNVNDPPEAFPDFYPSGPLSINAANGVLANDLDVDGDVLRAVLTSTTLHGVLNLATNGSFTYTPGADYRGGDRFYYRAADAALTSAPVRVKLGNTAPVAVLDVYPSADGQPLAITNPASGVLANDTDGEDDAIQLATLEAPPAFGALTFNEDGTFIYTPTNGYNGTDSFTYRANDGSEDSEPGLVKLGNTIPVAVADSHYSIYLNQTLTVSVVQGVLTNDTDADGDLLTAQLVATTTNGILSISTNGSFVYVPNPGFTGVDSFTYRARDPVTNSAPATVTIGVFDVLRPVAFSPTIHSAFAPSGGPFRVTFSKPVSVTGLAARITLHGSLSGRRTFSLAVSNEVVSITPSSGFRPGEVVNVTLQAGIRGTGFFELDTPFNWNTTVRAPRGGAIFTNQIASTNAMATEWVGAGDFNGDGRIDVIAFNRNAAPSLYLNNGDRTFSNRVLTLGATWNPASNPRGAVADFNGDGTMDFVVVNSFGQANLIALNDGTGNFNAASLPVFQNIGPYFFDSNRSITAGDFNGDGDVDLAFVGFYYVWIMRNDGTGQFTIENPVPVFNGNGNFVRHLASGDVDNDGDLDLYMSGFLGDLLLLNDGTGLFTPSTTPLDNARKDVTRMADVDGDGFLDLLMGPVYLNRAGTVWFNDQRGNFSRSVFEFNADYARDIAVGDYDGDGDFDVFLRDEGHSVSLNDGAGRFFATSQPIGYTNNFSKAVADFDNDGDLDVFVPRGGNTILDVAEVWYNQTPPRARDDLYAANGSNPVVISAVSGVLSNDSPGDGGAFIAVLVSNALRGTVSLSTNGSFTYTPGTNFTGSDVFLYRAVDSALSSSVARVKIGNSIPVSVNDTNYVVINDAALRVARPGVLGNDTDADNDPLSALLVSSPTNGTLICRSDGSFIYNASNNYVGSDSFTYRATDGFATSAAATVRLDVRAGLYLVNMTPPPNSTRANAADDLFLRFNRSLNPATVATNVIVHGQFTGRRGIARTTTGDTLRIDPTNHFRAAERVTVSLNRGLEGAGGERQPAPYVVQYQAEAPFGRGVFTDSGQRLGSNWISSVALGDFDGDGDLDAVQGPLGQFINGTNVPSTAAMIIWSNNGAGVFFDTGQRLGTNSISTISTADLDNDGDLDIVANHFVWYNNGAGVFTGGAPLVSVNMGNLVGDLNGDGWPDIVLTSFTNIMVWMNTGNGTFTNNPAAIADLNFINLNFTRGALGDLNGDGSLDIFVTPFFGDDPNKVWLNDGTGIFRESGQVFGNGGNSALLGDLDGDGDLDAVALFGSPFGGPKPIVQFNRGDGFFTPGSQLLPTNNVLSAALGDANGDGFLDLFVVQGTNPGFTNTSTIYFNDGTGFFTPGGQIIGDSTLNPTSGAPLVINRTIALGDLNNDGALDAWIAVDQFGASWAHHVWFNEAVLAPVEGGLDLVIPDTATAMLFTNMVVRGPTNVAITITLDDAGVAKGVFTTSSLAAGGFTGPVSNMFMRASGTVASAQAALRQLVFQPVANRVPVGSNEITRFTVRGISGPVVRTNDNAVVTAFSINDPPVAVNDGGTGFTGSASAQLVTTSVLANDFDVDPGDSFTIVNVNASGIVGTLTNLGGGVFRYTPPASYIALRAGAVATNTFTYTIRDQHNATAVGTVTLRSLGVNDPPVASNDVVTVSKNAGRTIITPFLLANDSDPDTGDQSTLFISAVNTNGTLGRVEQDPVAGVAYDPTGAFTNLLNGSIATTRFVYVLSDGGGATSTATVLIRVIGTDDPPVAVPDAFAILENAAPSNVTQYLLANDFDPDAGQTAQLFIEGVETASTIGLVTYSNGVVTYSPNGQFEALAVGQTTNDFFGYSIRSTTVGLIETVPVALSFLRRTNFVDVTVEVTPSGLLNLTYDGQTIFTNTPLPGYRAMDDARLAFGARTGGQNQLQEVDDVNLTLFMETPTNVTYDFNSGAPSGSVLFGSAVVTGGVVRLTPAVNNQLGSLILPDVTASNPVSGFLATFKIRMSGGTALPADGISFVWANDITNAAFGEDGAGYGLRISFDPYDNGNGEAPAIDARWRTVAATGMVTVTIVGENDPPVAVDDHIVMNEGAGATNITSALLANDIDPDHGETATLVVSGVSGATTFGVLSFTNGTVTYQPIPQPCLRLNATLTDSFTYWIRDVHGASNTAIATLYIVGTNTSATIDVLPTIAYDFNAELPTGIALFGAAFRDATNGVVVVTPGVGSVQGAVVIEAPDAAAVVAGFAASFRSRIDQTSASPADGFSFNWANDITNGTVAQAEEGAGTGLSVCFDLFDNGGGEAPAIDVKWRGGLVARQALSAADLVAGSNWVEVLVRMSPDGVLDVVYNCRPIFTRQVITGFVPQAGARFSFAARTGGSWARQSVDDVAIQIYPQPVFNLSAINFSNITRRVTMNAGAVSVGAEVPVLYRFQRSTDLVHWVDVSPVILAPGTAEVLIDTNDILPRAFYRGVR